MNTECVNISVLWNGEKLKKYHECTHQVTEKQDIVIPI